MFDEKTKQQLGSYVYALFSDDESFPFYIGKGVNNRVFDHLRCAVDEKEADVSSLKYDKIRHSKNIKHVIVRHGLTSNEAFDVECSLLDLLEYIKHPLTNIMGGHKSIEKGLMTTDEIIRYYNAEILERMPDNSVIININKQYKRGNCGDEIYRATKEIWVIGKNKLGKDGLPKFKYVLSEFNSLIVEVFEVESWYEKERGYGSGSKNNGKIRMGYGFDGIIASEEVRRSCLNRSIKNYKKQGQANPIRYKL